MRRLVCTVALALLATLASVRGGEAISGWCRTDPVITLDGRVASIWVTTEVFPDWAPGTTATIVVQIPVDVTPSVVFIDPNHGFQTFSISFLANPAMKKRENSIDVRIMVMTVIPRAQGTGAGVEWAMNAAGDPIAAATYGTVGSLLVLDTKLTW
jgi:hypothetical protein